MVIVSGLSALLTAVVILFPLVALIVTLINGTIASLLLIAAGMEDEDPSFLMFIITMIEVMAVVIIGAYFMMQVS